MRERNWWGIVGVVLLVGLLLLVGVSRGSVPAKADAPRDAGVSAPATRADTIRPDLTQLDGYSLRQIALPNFAYLYPYVYNYRLQYPTVSDYGNCAPGVLYITNSSTLDCWSPVNSTAWAMSKPLTLLYQRTSGIQAQIDNELQLDPPYPIGLLYGNASTSAGPVTLETVNLTTGAIATATTPVPMSNSVQADYVGGGIVVTWNGTGSNGAPELTNLSNGTSWRSGLAVGIAPNNVYWIPQLNAFIDVAGTHLAELKLEANDTEIRNVGNAWVNHTGLSSVTAVNGVGYRASTGQIYADLATNLGSYFGVVKLTGGVLTPAGAYGYTSSASLYAQRYAYTTPYLWALVGSTTELLDPLDNTTLAAPNLVSRANSSGANGNFEFTLPGTSSVYLSLNTALTGNASRAPNAFVWAQSPVAVHTRPFLVTSSLSFPTGAYQQLVYVNSAQDEPWETANLSNVFWTYTGNGSSIPAWLEANASNTSTRSVWWLSLASIPKSGSVGISEDFAAMTALTFSRTGVTGEAPQLTTTYAAFDNGAVVFPLYDDFRGTTLDSTLWAAAGVTLSVSNGLTTTSAPSPASGGACGLEGLVQNVTGNFSVDVYGVTNSAARFGPTVSKTGTSSACSTANSVVGNLDYSATAYQPSNLVGLFTQTSAGTITTNTCGLTWKTTSYYLSSLATIGSAQHVSNNESSTIGSCGTFSNYTVGATVYPAVWMKANSGTIGPIDYVRERAVVPTMPTVAGVPLAPTGFTLGSATGSTLTASWTNPPGAVSNDTLWRWLGSSCAGTATSFNLGVATSNVTYGLAEGTGYSAEVAAWNSSGMGALTSCAAATTLAPPAAPTGLTAGTPDTSHVPLAWNLPPGPVLNVTVAVGSTCGAPWIEELTLGDVSTYSVGGLKSTTRYTFAVAAANSTGLSSFSACVSATTATPGPSPGPTPGPNPPAPPASLVPTLPSDTLTIVVAILLVLVAIYAVGWLISPSKPDR